jgi:hypothetical protein
VVSKEDLPRLPWSPSSSGGLSEVQNEVRSVGDRQRRADPDAWSLHLFSRGESEVDCLLGRGRGEAGVRVRGRLEEVRKESNLISDCKRAIIWHRDLKSR